jgi:hypothetical protein
LDLTADGFVGWVPFSQMRDDAHAPPVGGKPPSANDPHRRGMSPRRSLRADSQLTRSQKVILTVGAIAVALVTVLHIVFPFDTTRTTTERDQEEFKTVVEVQSSRSDALILAGLGFAVILALTALLDARLKFTGPGGVGIEVQAVAAAANATIEPLEKENERLREEIAQARPDLAETVAREDPHVAAARQRWKEVDQRLRGDASDWPLAGGGRPDDN